MEGWHETEQLFGLHACRKAGHRQRCPLTCPPATLLTYRATLMVKDEEILGGAAECHGGHHSHRVHQEASSLSLT